MKGLNAMKKNTVSFEVFPVGTGVLTRAGNVGTISGIKIDVRDSVNVLYSVSFNEWFPVSMGEENFTVICDVYESPHFFVD